MVKNWRNTREYRTFRVGVIRRDKVCKLCGTRNKRHAHHIESASYNKALRFEVSNGICLCSTCHLSLFHYGFMGGTRKKTTAKHLARFFKLSKETTFWLKDKILEVNE